MQPPSKELLAQVKNGDRKAFGELYTQYRRPCYGLALMILKSHEDAEDAVQNTFIRIYGSIGTLQNDDAFVVWMERILNRECIKIANRRGIEIGSDDPAYSDRVPEHEEEFMLPELYAERSDLSQRLRDEIEKLPFEQRRAILLFHYHSMSLQQIAELTDSNLNTVKSRLRYARLSLRKNIEAQEKESGDRFYGVPLLPLTDILTRILDREKNRKSPAALWKRLQNDIDAVYGGFGGRLPDGGAHVTKLAAGVMAALLVLGAAAGALTGAVAQESTRGWSSMQGGDTPQNPEQVLSSEPGSQNDLPVQSPNQNNYTPAGADYLAQNVLNTPQNITDNNNRLPAVLPTQATPNTPVLPTQANVRTNAPERPTTPPQDTGEQNGNAYQAYRELLRQNAQAIQSYDWQYSDGSAPVALADLAGDSTPELVYLSASGNTATLHVYTYDGQKAVSLLSGSDFRSLSDVDDAYFLYQKSGDRRLYLYTASDSDYGTFRNIRFDENAGTLRAVELASGRLYPSQYTIGGSAVSEAAYADYEKTLFSDISGILLRNDIRGMCSDEAYDALSRTPSSAMSLNDMLSYLEE